MKNYKAVLGVFVATALLSAQFAQAQTLPTLSVSGSYPTKTTFALGENAFVSITAGGPGYSGIEKIQILRNNKVLLKECSIATNKYFLRQPVCTAGETISKLGTTTYSAVAYLTDGTVIKGNKVFRYYGVDTLDFSASAFARNVVCAAMYSPTYYGYLIPSCVGILPTYINDPTSAVGVKLSSDAAWSTCSYDSATRQYACVPGSMYPENKASVTRIEFSYNGEVASRPAPLH